MERMKALIAQALVAGVVAVGMGLGLVVMGVAMIVGLVITLAVRLAGPQILAEAERRATDLRSEAAHPVNAEAAPI
ncbi:hypothetical protein [Primorskyibacter marinus]|uniref:hypothetical protein n=1 Tax=Primorskyibacter marinus TaxID=1977320 RepID=UPI000E308D15|nr:hypothetical protein [Primorskyibacter marinus]